MGAISEFMSRDHDRLDVIFAEFRKEPDAGKAKELFPRFDAGLRSHIAWEEEILFPPFEEKTGMRDAGPTAVMRMEHRQIKQLLAFIEQAIGQRDAAESARALVEVLTAHNHKEENILYPWLDQSLSGGEASALLNRITNSGINP
jgi:iron-sulfur cluster repair protein YtfE (RIC family)